jgi:hypothetical protein
MGKGNLASHYSIGVPRPDKSLKSKALNWLVSETQRISWARGARMRAVAAEHTSRGIAELLRNMRESRHG